MGKKLKNAPVFYAVAQVQFNPMLDLFDFMPQIQSQLRKEGLPDYRQIHQQQLAFSADLAMAPVLQARLRFLFGDIEERSMIIVDTNALAFVTTAYDTFETFLATLMRGLEILHGQLGIDFVERVGLRYLDAVQAGSLAALADFLVPEVLGMSAKGPGRLQHSISETVLATTHGELVTRVLIKEGALVLPDDLGASPALLERFRQFTGLHAVIDTDAFIAKREPFNLGTIQTRLHSLHDEIDQSFRATVTEHALTSWA